MVSCAEQLPAESSVSEFAVLIGVSRQAVHKAADKGRFTPLALKIVNGERRLVVPNALREWLNNGDRSKAPAKVIERVNELSRLLGPAPPAAALTVQAIQPPHERPPAKQPDARHADEDPDEEDGKPTTLTDAVIDDKFWSAKTRELRYLKEKGELVNAREVATRMTDLFTMCRTKILAIPSKAKTALPTLTPSDIGTLDALLREALEDLASTTVAPAVETPVQ